MCEVRIEASNLSNCIFLIRSKDDEFTKLNSFLLTGKVKIALKFVSEDFMPNPLILPP